MILVERGQDPPRRPDSASSCPSSTTTARGRSPSSSSSATAPGLIADNPIGDYAGGPEAHGRSIAGAGPGPPAGHVFVYSDVGFMILGRTRREGRRQAARRVRPRADLRAARDGRHRLPPAGGDRPGRPRPSGAGGEMLRGVVHDPRSRALGGVAGHAGLFCTADDLAVFAQMLLDGGTGPNGRRILAPLTVRAMIDPGDTPAAGASRARLGRRHVLQRPAGIALRAEELRPHRVHRDEPLGRPGDRDVRDRS